MARKKQSLKKIKSLVFLMLITLILGITATYAWFSTQRDVEIVGMRLNVEVSESMQISLDGEKWTQSIQIADMRQFYGTYNPDGDEDFAIYQAKKVSEGGNENYVPKELLPVSTAGEVVNGKLQFVQGTLTNNPDGTQSLTEITACTETDITKTAEISTKEMGNANHPYLVFDMYLRNISAKTTGIDELKLNEGSTVWVNTGNEDDEEQEGKGVGGTGLEYSARVGFIVYGNTVSVTAQDDATLGTIGQQIRGIEPKSTDVAAIWEPNYIEHTQYVVNNNGRGITSTLQEVTTYGIKSAIASQAEPNNAIANVNASVDANADGIEDTNANLVAVKTFKPAYTAGESGTVAKEIITNTNGDNIGLKPNQISKVRVYIWLEGQDPDCVDMASTGDKLNVTLKLTKDANTIDDNTYVGEYTGGSGNGSGGSSSNGITAAEIYAMTDEEKQEFYGATVKNYNSIMEMGDDELEWQIFHVDRENIYLITDRAIENGLKRPGKNRTPYNFVFGDYGSDLNSRKDYSGTADINSSLALKLLREFTNTGYTETSQNDNAKATAYLMDIDIWEGFEDSNGYADYAMGGPTIELFVDSYNATHPDDTIDIRVLDEKGYEIAWSAEGNYSHTINDMDSYEGLYGNTPGNQIGIWLASPSAYQNGGNMMIVSEDGSSIGANNVDYGVFRYAPNSLSKF